MDILGIDIKAGSWHLLHLKRTPFGVRVAGRTVLGGADTGERLDGLTSYVSSRSLGRKVRIAVSLPRGAYIARALEVPAPSEEALTGILRFEIEKHLPYPVEEAYYSTELLKKDGNTYTVYFAAARRDYVDSLIGEFGARGLAPHVVGVEQASFLNAAVYWKKLSESVNTAIVGAGPDGFTLDLLGGITPVYSKNVHMRGPLGQDWTHRVQAELKTAVGISRQSLSGKGIDRCIVASGAITDGAFLAELSAVTGLEVESGECLKGTGVEPEEMVAFGVAVSAMGKGVYSIDLDSPRPDNTLRNTVALSMAVAACLLVVAVSYIGKDFVAARRVESVISELEARGESMRSLTKTAIEIDESVEALERSKGLRSYGVMEVLKELSETLPSHTWLTGFEFKGENVYLEGYSSNASSMLFVLENSQMFKDLELTGQVTKRNGAEHFTLKLRTRAPGGARDAPEGT